MAYDASIEKRIDALIALWPNVEKKKMFGGVCYLTGGNMCFGIWQHYLIVRSGAAAAQLQMQKDFVRPFDVTGKPMKGWFMVAPEGCRSDDAMNTWLEMGKDFAMSLPEK